VIFEHRPGGFDAVQPAKNLGIGEEASVDHGPVLYRSRI
jgi:hypothetical protein